MAGMFHQSRTLRHRLNAAEEYWVQRYNQTESLSDRSLQAASVKALSFFGEYFFECRQKRRRLMVFVQLANPMGPRLNSDEFLQMLKRKQEGYIFDCREYADLHHRSNFEVEPFDLGQTTVRIRGHHFSSDAEFITRQKQKLRFVTALLARGMAPLRGRIQRMMNALMNDLLGRSPQVVALFQQAH